MQSVVNFNLASGMIGEFAFDGPQRVQVLNIHSADPLQNVVGRAYTFDPTDQTRAGANNSGTVFAGILAFPKEYASYGTVAGGPLAPTLRVANNSPVEFVTMGELWVTLLTAANIGDIVCFEDTTGILDSYAPGGSPATGFTTIPNCYVSRYEAPTAEGLACIKLTN